MPPLQADQWALLVVALVLVGAAKTSFSGFGVFAVALFALALPARQSTGALLPLLLLGDLLALALYRRHADWRRLLRLLPWVAVGVVCGAAVIGRVDDEQTRRLIGLALLVVLAAALLRRRLERSVIRSAAPLAVPAVGVAAGFLTMVANAAGPLMNVYLLSAGLPVLAFLGTSAWFFLLVNLFKVPFSAGLGLITPASLALLVLAPAVVLGAVAGRLVVTRVDQALFERVTLGLVLVAALRLLL